MPMSPSSVLAITRLALPDQISRSGVTSATNRVTAPPRQLPRRRARSRLAQLLGLLLHVLDAAAHVERLLGELVVPALADRLERGNRVLDRHEHPGYPGELLGHEHRLGQEPLDPPRPLDQDLVLLGQFVDAEDRDDVLQFLVPLEDPLYLARDIVVFLPDILRVQDPRRRVER